MAKIKITPPTQEEISLSLQTPYVNPETGESRGNPNEPNLPNRGNQVSFKGDTTKPFSLGFEDIDNAIFYYMENIIKPTVQQNGVVQKVPVIYSTPERFKQIQKDGFYRDKRGKIMMPLITFKRNSIERNRSLTRKLDANKPHNIQYFTKNYSKTNSYDNFNILNNRQPLRQHYAVVVPDYVNITYDFIVSTYYVEQLNKITEAINYASDSYWGHPEKFKFKANIDNFSTPLELPSKGERTVKASFSLKLYGYLIPDVIQKEITHIKKVNSKTQIIFSTEVVSNINDLVTP